MELIFEKKDFPQAPGGDRYEWDSAQIKFQVPCDGKYIVEIVASAKSEKQKRSSDDDDLRIAIDDYEFGKYEMHDEKISWKGFGTSSSWDGASLKGMPKTIFLFMELKKGDHAIRFFADGKPNLKWLKIFSLEDSETFKIDSVESSSTSHNSDRKGIPWMSFVFLGVKPRYFSIGSVARSASQKGMTDGDNLKIVVNGKILQNPIALRSRKYKNFYFSGDLNKGKEETLILAPKDFEFLEDSVELWHDQNPTVSINIDFFKTAEAWLGSGIPENTTLKFYELTLRAIVKVFALARYKYSSRFLNHSLSNRPHQLIFDDNSEIVKKLKKDSAYLSILSILQDQIRRGILDGQIPLGDESNGLKVDLTSKDLAWSLHGLKKIQYKATPKINKEYDLEFTIFDVYDFDPKSYLSDPLVAIPIHMADTLEKNLLLKNFEIELKITETIALTNV